MNPDAGRSVSEVYANLPSRTVAKGQMDEQTRDATQRPDIYTPVTFPLSLLQWTLERGSVIDEARMSQVT